MDIKNAEQELEKVDSFLTILKNVLKKHNKTSIICKMFNPNSPYVDESTLQLHSMIDDETNLLEKFDMEIEFIIQSLIDNVDYFKEQVDVRKSPRHWFHAYVTSLEHQLLSLAIRNRDFPMIFDGFLYPLEDLDEDRGELSRDAFIKQLSHDVREVFKQVHSIDDEIPIEFIIKSWN
jgi:hypothetical protein